MTKGSIPWPVACCFPNPIPLCIMSQLHLHSSFTYWHDYCSIFSTTIGDQQASTTIGDRGKNICSVPLNVVVYCVLFVLVLAHVSCFGISKISGSLRSIPV
jgi:hypothetical protein